MEEIYEQLTSCVQLIAVCDFYIFMSYTKIKALQFQEQCRFESANVLFLFKFDDAGKKITSVANGFQT